MHKFPKLTALLLGAIAVTGYAPFYLFPLPILTLAGLFHLWQAAASRKQGFLLGYCYGLGLFGAGVSWIYVSLHDFGGMPMPVAIIATAAFCAFLALFPAFAGWLSAHFQGYRRLAAPAAWVLMEWVLNWIFTGFPWMAIGYSQIPHSPLAGLAPIFGVYGVSLAAATSASLVAAWIGGSALKHVHWTQPQGAPISVSLLQGNIPQDMKWQPEEINRTLRTYIDLVAAHPAQLVVMPETAIPLLLHHIPGDYAEALTELARRAHGDILLGVPEREDGRYYNSMVSTGSSPVQKYRKSHLVPFGEFIPFKSVLGWIYNELLHIPLADLSPGATHQQPLHIAGQKVAVNICYEDVFGEEIIRQLPQATLLVNGSNDAWYGRSLAAHQHLQISQTRALETGRMMLRATNTGATAIIDPAGEIVAEAPHFTTTALTGEAQGYSGTTPYVRWGNWPAISLIVLALGLLWVREKK